MTTIADVLVIGGGIAGIGVAARLSPDAKVIVLERENAIGTHSTARSAAIYVQNYGNETLRALTAASEAVYVSGELSDTPLLTPRGELAIARESDLDEFHAFCEAGTGLERLTPAQAVSLFPILKQSQIAAAALETDARDIDVDALLQGYARLLRQHGGEVRTGIAISEIFKDKNWRVTSQTDTFEAPILVNAAGAWADEVAARAVVRQIGLVPMRRTAAILPAPKNSLIDDWPMVGAFDESWYAKPTGGKLLVSPSDEDPISPQDAWPDDMVLAEGLDRFEQATTYRVSRVERSWAGLRSFVADRTPVAGFALDAEGFFWLAGQGGYGIQTSPALSQLAADLIVGRNPSISSDIVEKLSAGRESIGPGVPFG